MLSVLDKAPAWFFSIRRLAQLTPLLVLLLATPSEATGPRDLGLRDPWAEGGPSQAADIKVSLVTFGVGDSIPEWFGHTAVLVEDQRLQISRIFNYGMFDFGPDMLPKFLMGRLEFWVGEDAPAQTFAFYERQLNREIHLQELNLTNEKRLQLARALSKNALPENRRYLYHHYDNNCATRVRDLIDESVDGQLRKASQAKARLNLRQHTRLRFQKNPYVNEVLIFWMNKEIDRPIRRWEEMFLPSELESQVQAFSYRDPSGALVPMVKAETTLYKAKGRSPLPKEASTTWPFMLLVGSLAAALSLFLLRRFWRTQRKRDRVLIGLWQMFLGLSLGTPALVLAFFWIFTEHTVTHANENLFLANPLTFLLFPLSFGVLFGWRWAQVATRFAWMLLAISALIYLPLMMVPSFQQFNLDTLVFFLPLNLAQGAACFWWWRSAPPGHAPALEA